MLEDLTGRDVRVAPVLLTVLLIVYTLNPPEVKFTNE